MTERQRYRAEDLHKFCCAVLQKLNVPREDAQEVGDCLVLADLRGVDSHGVIRLPVYALRIRKYVVNAGAMPRIIRTHAAAALMDGDNGLGAVVGSRAMEKAIELATTAGIGFVGVRRTNHFGIASYYVQMALQQDSSDARHRTRLRTWPPLAAVRGSLEPIPSQSEFQPRKKRLCCLTPRPAWSRGERSSSQLRRGDDSVWLGNRSGRQPNDKRKGGACRISVALRRPKRLGNLFDH